MGVNVLMSVLMGVNVLMSVLMGVNVLMGAQLWGRVKDFYSCRPGSTWDFTNVWLIVMNDSFIKCVSSILKY